MTDDQDGFTILSVIFATLVLLILILFGAMK